MMKGGVISILSFVSWWWNR